LQKPLNELAQWAFWVKEGAETAIAVNGWAEAKPTLAPTKLQLQFVKKAVTL